MLVVLRDFCKATLSHSSTILYSEFSSGLGPSSWFVGDVCVLPFTLFLVFLKATESERSFSVDESFDITAARWVLSESKQINGKRETTTSIQMVKMLTSRHQPDSYQPSS